MTGVNPEETESSSLGLHFLENISCGLQFRSLRDCYHNGDLSCLFSGKKNPSRGKRFK